MAGMAGMGRTPSPSPLELHYIHWLSSKHACQGNRHNCPGGKSPVHLDVLQGFNKESSLRYFCWTLQPQTGGRIWVTERIWVFVEFGKQENQQCGTSAPKIKAACLMLLTGIAHGVQSSYSVLMTHSSPSAKPGGPCSVSSAPSLHKLCDRKSSSWALIKSIMTSWGQLSRWMHNDASFIFVFIAHLQPWPLSVGTESYCFWHVRICSHRHLCSSDLPIRNGIN